MHLTAFSQARFRGVLSFVPFRAFSAPVVLACALASCSGDESGAPKLDGGSTAGDAGAGGHRGDAGANAGGDGSAGTLCETAQVHACACSHDAVCCGSWDMLCDAVVEAFFCNRCTDSGDGGAGSDDPGYDPDYHGGPRDAGVDAGADGDAGDADVPAALQCQDFRIEVARAQTEVLVVLDRSGSMRDLTVDRWGPSVRAVEELSRALSPTMSVGLMTFPGDCSAVTDAAERSRCDASANSFFGNLSCEPGQIKVSPALNTADAITNQLTNSNPGGATPTAASLQVAGAALKGAAQPGENQLILLVTDGAPNCAGGSMGGLGAVGTGSASGQPEAVTQTVAAIGALDQSGIRSYVLGYDTARDAELSASLDRMAVAGGTGDTKYHPVEDQASLQTALLSLAQKSAECTLVLQSAVPAPFSIEVKLDGAALVRDAVDGYSLSPDGSTLRLGGAACTTYSTGTRHVLFVKGACPPAPPPPPSDADAGAADAGADTDSGDDITLH